MQRFCGDIAFPIDPLFRGEGLAIEQLAQLAGCDVAALERMSVRHLGKGISVCETNLPPARAFSACGSVSVPSV